MMKVLCGGLLCLFIAGCVSSFYETSRHIWDGWIGTTKDERVRDLGIPVRCHTFKVGGEACEWPVRVTHEAHGNMTLQFDPRGQVCQWTFRDQFGDLRSQQQCN